MAIINAIPMAGRLGDYFNLTFPNASYDDNGYITAITASLVGSSFSTSLKTNLTEISFPKCSSIASSAFANATSLQSINLPQLTFLGSYAFSGCTLLSDIYLPQLSVLWTGAFKNCTSLTKINLPQGNQLMSSVFQSCSNLVSFTTKNFMGVGEYAFDGCKTLKDFIVTDYIYTQLQLRSYCFRSCYALSVFPFSICAFIEGSAFAHCSALTTVSLTSCSYISAYAFEYCTSLNTIYLMNSNVVSAPSNIFYSAGIKSNTGSIYVPTSLVSVYKSATGWSYFKSIIYGV